MKRGQRKGEGRIDEMVLGGLHPTIEALFPLALISNQSCPTLIFERLSCGVEGHGNPLAIGLGPVASRVLLVGRRMNVRRWEKRTQHIS